MVAVGAVAGGFVGTVLAQEAHAGEAGFQLYWVGMETGEDLSVGVRRSKSYQGSDQIAVEIQHKGSPSLKDSPERSCGSR